MSALEGGGSVGRITGTPDASGDARKEELDPKFQAALKQLKKLENSNVPKKDRLPFATRGLGITEAGYRQFEEIVRQQEAGQRAPTKSPEKKIKVPSAERPPTPPPVPRPPEVLPPLIPEPTLAPNLRPAPEIEVQRRAVIERREKKQTEGAPPTESAPEPVPPMPEPGSDPRRFRPVLSPEQARGGASTENAPLYEYVSSDGSVAVNPDGTPRFYSKEDVDIAWRVFNEVRKLLETGSRATEIARSPESAGMERSAIDIARPPALLEGAKVMTQREIHTDPKMEKLFLKVLNRLDEKRGEGRGAEIYAKAISEEILTTEDLRVLAYARYEFANRLAVGESLAAKTVEADIKIAMRRNQDFRNEVELNGLEYTMGVMKEQAKILAMTMSQSDLDEIVKAYQVLDTDRNTLAYKTWETAFQDLMKQSSTSWDGYKGAIKVGERRSRIETRHRIEEKIAEGYGGFRNAISKFNPFFARSRFSQADRMVHGFDMIEQLRQRPGIIKEVDEALAVITRFMAFTLDHDPEVRRALQQSAFRNENISPSESKPSTFKEARAERARLADNPDLSLPNMQGFFERDRKTWHMKDGRGYDEMTEPEIRKGLNTWEPKELQSLQQAQGSRRGGFWNAVFGFILESITSRRKKQLKLRK